MATLTQCSKVAFLCFCITGWKRYADGPTCKNFLPCFKVTKKSLSQASRIVKNFFGNLKIWLRSKNASYSFYFKAPSVIVYEITGIITRETSTGIHWPWLWIEEGYQLPESGPTGQWLIFCEKTWRQEKSKPGAKQKSTPLSRPVGCQTAPLLSFHKAWLVLLWPEESHRNE